MLSVDVAVAYLEAFGKQDMAAAARYLAPDIVFESPRATLRGAEATLAAVGEFAQVVTGVDIVAALGDEERAMVMYDMRTGPFGTLRAVDYVVVRDGLIVEDVLVFDTHPVRSVSMFAPQAPLSGIAGPRGCAGSAAAGGSW